MSVVAGLLNSNDTWLIKGLRLDVGSGRYRCGWKDPAEGADWRSKGRRMRLKKQTKTAPVTVCRLEISPRREEGSRCCTHLLHTLARPLTRSGSSPASRVGKYRAHKRTGGEKNEPVTKHLGPLVHPDTRRLVCGWTISQRPLGVLKPAAPNTLGEKEPLFFVNKVGIWNL